MSPGGTALPPSYAILLLSGTGQAASFLRPSVSNQSASVFLLGFHVRGCPGKGFQGNRSLRTPAVSEALSAPVVLMLKDSMAQNSDFTTSASGEMITWQKDLKLQ